MAISPLSKNHRRLNGIIKGIIVGLFLWVLYRQVTGKNDLTAQWETLLTEGLGDRLYYLLGALILLPLNILTESLKWKSMIDRFEHHPLNKAILSVLSGITAGLITPARIGDYVGKLMFIAPANNWKAVWSNLTGSIAQHIAIIGGGTVGTIFYLYHALEIRGGLVTSLMITGLILLIVLGWFYYHLHWLPRLLQFLKKLKILKNLLESLQVVFRFDHRILHQVLGLAFIRYLLFSLQYVLLLKFWGIPGAPLHLLAAVSLIFLIQSALPFPPVINILARTEVALLVLSSASDNSLAILSAAFSIWIINLGIPALIGLFILLKTDITKSLGYE